MIVKQLILLLSIVTFSLTVSANDEPTGQSLLDSCKAYDINQADDLQSMMCLWYVMPCDCEKKDQQIPKVCLPDKVDESSLIKLVIKGLSSQKRLLTESAELAANTILSQHYPCSD